MKRILVVDADPGFAEQIGGLLGNGFEIEKANTSVAARQKVCEQRPDLILLGYLEPRGEAFNLHRELREQEGASTIPILVVDVKPNEHLRKGWRRFEGLQMDAEGYLSRPLNPQIFKSEIARILSSASARILAWTQILEQMEETLLQEVESWSAPGQQFPLSDAERLQKQSKKQAAAMRV